MRYVETTARGSISEAETITVIRAAAMILIVLCHYVSWYPSISFVGQVFNVGVPLFFVISGFLYGGKTIENIPNWYIKQLIKISVPILYIS